MGHSVIYCDNCSSPVMEGSNSTWECECGWSFKAQPTPSFGIEKTKKVHPINLLMSKIDSTETQSQRNKEVQDIIKNTSYPINARWDLYIKAVEANYLNAIKSWVFIPDVLEKENFTLYDDTFVDRHQTYNYEDLIDEETLGKEENHELTNEEIKRLNLIKEEILQDGHSAWINDW